jgi:hypothetical protein
MDCPQRDLQKMDLRQRKKNSWRFKMFFKTSSLSREALLIALKTSLFMLEVYKKQNSIGSRLNAL